MLPQASNATIFQSTLPRLWWAIAPFAFVIAAYNRSVPIAIGGGYPKTRRRGVINDPPPTPVTPIAKPTAAPAIMWRMKSMS